MGLWPSIFFTFTAITTVVVAGCGPNNSATATRSAAHTPAHTPLTSPTLKQTATATPTPFLPTATPSPTIRPTSTSTRVPTITPTPHPMNAYTIEALRTREYPGGDIELRSILAVTESYTRYYISYPSDDLTITGIMQVPPGVGPFPVIILNHGWIDPEEYWPGADTWRAAEYLNSRGYLTLASDFRGWGESDSSDNFFEMGILIDTLNLVSSLPSIPEANIERIGMWGHSMGGGVTIKAITIDPRVKAAILYAPVSGHNLDVFTRWGVDVRADVGERLLQAYIEALSRPEFLARTSPNNYFDFVVAPVQIHIGTADTSTPPEWSVKIGEALVKSGNEVEFYVYPGQGHAFQGQSWRLFMGHVADFFDRHLGNPP